MGRAANFENYLVFFLEFLNEKKIPVIIIFLLQHAYACTLFVWTKYDIALWAVPRHTPSVAGGGADAVPPRLPVRKRTCKRRRRCRRRRCRHAVAVDSVARADHHGPQRRVRRVHRGRLHDRLANVLR